MFDIMNREYKEKSGIDIAIADLGHSTENLSFFVEATVKNSITINT
jgi:hypothetical protein